MDTLGTQNWFLRKLKLKLIKKKEIRKEKNEHQKKKRKKSTAQQMRHHKMTKKNIEQNDRKGQKQTRWEKNEHCSGQFCPKHPSLFSLMFSLQFRDIMFWWTQRENGRIPQFSFLQNHFSQTLFLSNKISYIFPSLFSIPLFNLFKS